MGMIVVVEVVAVEKEIEDGERSRWEPPLARKGEDGDRKEVRGSYIEV